MKVLSLMKSIQVGASALRRIGTESDVGDGLCIDIEFQGEPGLLHGKLTLDANDARAIKLCGETPALRENSIRIKPSNLEIIEKTEHGEEIIPIDCIVNKSSGTALKYEISFETESVSKRYVGTFNIAEKCQSRPRNSLMLTA